MELRRYWFKFDITIQNNPPIGTLVGCGVTAYNYDDAMNLIKEMVFKTINIPPLIECIEDVNVLSLDSNHVLPNMGLVTVRGIWFPLGYEKGCD